MSLLLLFNSSNGELVPIVGTSSILVDNFDFVQSAGLSSQASSLTSIDGFDFTGSAGLPYQASSLISVENFNFTKSGSLPSRASSYVLAEDTSQDSKLVTSISGNSQSSVSAINTVNRVENNITTSSIQTLSDFDYLHRFDVFLKMTLSQPVLSFGGERYALSFIYGDTNNQVGDFIINEKGALNIIGSSYKTINDFDYIQIASLVFSAVLGTSVQIIDSVSHVSEGFITLIGNLQNEVGGFVQDNNAVAKLTAYQILQIYDVVFDKEGVVYSTGVHNKNVGDFQNVSKFRIGNWLFLHGYTISEETKGYLIQVETKSFSIYEDVFGYVIPNEIKGYVISIETKGYVLSKDKGGDMYKMPDKQPGEVIKGLWLDFVNLLGDTETIFTATVTSNIPDTVDNVAFNSTKVTWDVKGGTHGDKIVFTVKVVGTDGSEREREAGLFVIETPVGY